MVQSLAGGGAAVRTVRGLISGDLPEGCCCCAVGALPHLEALRPTMDPPPPLGMSSARGSGESGLLVAAADAGVDDFARDGGENSVAVGDVRFPARPVDLHLVVVKRLRRTHTHRESREAEREKYTIVSL